MSQIFLNNFGYSIVSSPAMSSKARISLSDAYCSFRTSMLVVVSVGFKNPSSIFSSSRAKVDSTFYVKLGMFSDSLAI